MPSTLIPVLAILPFFLGGTSRTFLRELLSTLHILILIGSAGTACDVVNDPPSDGRNKVLAPDNVAELSSTEADYLADHENSGAKDCATAAVFDIPTVSGSQNMTWRVKAVDAATSMFNRLPALARSLGIVWSDKTSD